MGASLSENGGTNGCAVREMSVEHRRGVWGGNKVVPAETASSTGRPPADSAQPIAPSRRLARETLKKVPFVPAIRPVTGLSPKFRGQFAREFLTDAPRGPQWNVRLVVSKLPDLARAVRKLTHVLNRSRSASRTFPGRRQLRKDCRHVGAVSEEKRKHRHQQ